MWVNYRKSRSFPQMWGFFNPESTREVCEVVITFLQNYSPIVQALLGNLFTWGTTALGASVVFLKRELFANFWRAMLGFAAMMTLDVASG
jgi:hypothetical protein